MPNEKNNLDLVALGERIRYLREKSGLGQTELAQKLGYKRSSTISNLETGKTPPDLAVILKITGLFNINLHWLATGKPSPDGEAWRTSYFELLRAYDRLASWALDRLECELADFKKEKNELREKESRGETINLGRLDLLEREIIPPREAKIEQIKTEQKKSLDRYSKPA